MIVQDCDIEGLLQTTKMRNCEKSLMKNTGSFINKIFYGLKDNIENLLVLYQNMHQ